MWKCKKCGEQIEDTFDACWNCGTGIDGAPPQSGLNLDQGKNKPILKSARQKTSRSSIGFCPFSWIQVTKPAGCFSSIFGGKEKQVTEPQPCMTSSCQLWDSSAINCGLITKK